MRCVEISTTRLNDTDIDRTMSISIVSSAPSSSNGEIRYFLSSDVSLRVKVKIDSLCGRVVADEPFHAVARTSARHAALYQRNQREL